jgi:hypothetical protein
MPSTTTGVICSVPVSGMVKNQAGARRLIVCLSICVSVV